MWSVLLLVASIVLIVVLTTQLRLHPFAALLLAAFFFGTLAGMPPTEIVTAINDGFGQTIGSIGIVIVAGTVIGTFLHHSGAAQVLATGFVRLAGPKRVPIAMGAVGYVVSMPVFCDSGFVLLSPINRALAAKHGVSLAACAVALSLGLYATHTMVPPTPGPVAAAGIIGADLGIVIGVGVLISIVALSAGIWFAYRYASRVELNTNENDVQVDENFESEPSPSSLDAALPIALPILLIVGRTIAELPVQPFGVGTTAELLSFLGQPAIALSIGVVAALRLPYQLSRKMLSGTVSSC
jgi:GntP family gluconate:H+ symporter